MTMLRALWADESGAVQAETAIIIACVTLAAISLWQALGDTVAESAQETTGGLSEQ